MHMADALLSPVVGGAMWLVAGAAIAVSARRLHQRADDELVPLMGMLGAFVFAAQMVNFSIPATGSSGHLGGGLLLAILLGPHAAFLVMASVLTVQALFFADGGLLALGANLFNLGWLPCFVAYPLVYRPLAGAAPTARRSTVAAVAAAVIGLQLGALCVVMQTTASGISSLPLRSFLAVMLPIHAAIGVVEGLATAALLRFLHRARPELLSPAAELTPVGRRPLLRRLAMIALFAGGVLSWFSSTRPDGLEWAVARAAGTQALAAPRVGVHATLDALQHRTAVLPGYALPAAAPASAAAGEAAWRAWPDVNGSTSLSGLLGGAVTVALVGAIGLGLRWRRRPT
jgi:cobalt/nickel transport system permease protein